MYRWGKLVINGVEIYHEEQQGLYFECEYNSGKGNEIGSMVFRIYNLVQEVNVGSTISYDFGRGNYGGRFGTFTVKKRNVKLNGADRVQELFCSERAVESSNIVSIGLKGQIKSSQAIKEICRAAGLLPVQIELTEDKTFPTSFSCFGKALDELRKIAVNCNTKMKIEDKEVYFYKEKPEQKSIIELRFDSGLLKNPTNAEKLVLDGESQQNAENGVVQAAYNTGDKIKSANDNEYDYTIECLSIHTLKKGVMLSVQGSNTFNGLCRIHSLTMNNADTWTMKLNVKKL